MPEFSVGDIIVSNVNSNYMATIQSIHYSEAEYIVYSLTRGTQQLSWIYTEAAYSLHTPAPVDNSDEYHITGDNVPTPFRTDSLEKARGAAGILEWLKYDNVKILKITAEEVK